MANILLVTFSGGLRTPTSLVLDNGLASLAAALMDEGHGVRIEDMNTVSIMAELALPAIQREAAELVAMSAPGKPLSEQSLARLFEIQRRLDAHQRRVVKALYERIERIVARDRVTVVGFKCWMGEGVEAVRVWSRRIRSRHPNVKIMLGGPACQVAPNIVARYVRDFDALVIGEGEVRVPALVNAWESGASIESIPGLVRFFDGDVQRTSAPTVPVDMGGLPMVRYDRAVYPAAGTPDKLNFVMIDESRGCPMGCYFCVHPSNGSRWRMKSVSRIVSEMDAARDSIGATYFRLTGSFTPPALLDGMARELLSLGRSYQYSCFMHFSGARRGTFSDLAASGLRAVFFGMESADEDLLRRATGKRLSVAGAKETLEEAARAGIFSTVSYMFPLPFETPASERATIELLHQTFAANSMASAIVVNPFPFPGTPWWDNREHYGFEFQDDAYLRAAIRFRARILQPPETQQGLPYSLGGQDSKAMGARLAPILRGLDEAGAITNVDDAIAMIAYGCGYSPREFRRDVGRAFLGGDVDTIGSMVTRFNTRTGERADGAGLRRVV